MNASAYGSLISVSNCLLFSPDASGGLFAYSRKIKTVYPYCTLVDSFHDAYFIPALHNAVAFGAIINV